MSRRLIVAVAAAVLVGVCGWAVAGRTTPPPTAEPDAKRELMDADLAFAKATAEKGIDGWMSFMADDAVRIAPLGGKAHVGKAAVRELDAKMFADPNRKLLWEPTDGGAFADGSHGFTTGRSRVVVKSADGKEEVRSTGNYVTWWRKGPDGRWKVILDTGATDPPKK
jgi:ketosteroid isomerase-like protein